MTKLKLIPRHQRGGFVVPNNADLKALLAADWKNKLDYMRLAQQEYTPKEKDPAFAHFYRQTPAQPTVPQQQVVQQPVPAAKRNVQIPADALAGIQFKAPDLGGLQGTEPAPIQAKQGGNQRTDLQNYFGTRAANGEINRALHGRNFTR